MKAEHIHTDKPPHGDRRFWGEGDGFTKYSQTLLTKRSQSFHKGIRKALTRAFTKPSQKHSQSFHKDIHKALTNSLARHPQEHSQGHSQRSHNFSRAKRGDFFRAAPRARMRSSPARSAAIFSGQPPRARTRREEEEEENTNLTPQVSFQDPPHEPERGEKKKKKKRTLI